MAFFRILSQEPTVGYMSKQEVAFLQGRLLSSQSQPFKNFQKVLIGWREPTQHKSHFVFGHVNWINLP